MKTFLESPSTCSATNHKNAPSLLQPNIFIQFTTTSVIQLITLQVISCLKYSQRPQQCSSGKCRILAYMQRREGKALGSKCSNLCHSCQECHRPTCHGLSLKLSPNWCWAVFLGNRSSSEGYNFKAALKRSSKQLCTHSAEYSRFASLIKWNQGELTRVVEMKKVYLELWIKSEFQLNFFYKWWVISSPERNAEGSLIRGLNYEYNPINSKSIWNTEFSFQMFGHLQNKTK